VVTTLEFPYIQLKSKLGLDKKSESIVNVLPEVGVNIPMYFAAHHEKNEAE